MTGILYTILCTQFLRNIYSSSQLIWTNTVLKGMDFFKVIGTNILDIKAYHLTYWKKGGKNIVIRHLDKSVCNFYFSYFSNKTYVVGTQKNCLNEMVL